MVMFNFLYHKGIIRLESIFFGMNLLIRVLYFMESAAALNVFEDMLYEIFVHNPQFIYKI